MKRSAIFVFILAIVATGCGSTISPASPDASAGPLLSASVLRALAGVGPFVGTTTANNSYGHNGTISVTFSTDNPVQATVAWSSAGVTGTFMGDVTGTSLTSITANAQNPTAPGGCTSFTATGSITVNGAVETFSGTYSASCHHSQNAVVGDSGTFTASRAIAAPPAPLCGPFTFQGPITANTGSGASGALAYVHGLGSQYANLVAVHPGGNGGTYAGNNNTGFTFTPSESFAVIIFHKGNDTNSTVYIGVTAGQVLTVPSNGGDTFFFNCQ